MANIGVVIVTFNRLEKLKKALSAYKNQLLLPKYIIVVNNASTDDTANWLNEWKHIDDGFEKCVIQLPVNTGGSGGFYEGEKAAVAKDADWIMIADDDAYPEKDYLYGMSKFIDSINVNDYSIVCGKVVEQGRFVHRCMLRSKWILKFTCDPDPEVYKKAFFEFDFASYVGILINKTKMIQAGLVKKEYFIWHDDFEHSLRLKKLGKFVCLPKYTIVHDTENTVGEISWKDYYGFRNCLDVFRQHFKLQFPFVMLVFFIKTLLIPLKGKSLKEVALRLTAIKDALLGNLGKHPVYKPGWKP